MRRKRRRRNGPKNETDINNSWEKNDGRNKLIMHSSCSRLHELDLLEETLNLKF
jgi:hypothetical protein